MTTYESDHWGRLASEIEEVVESAYKQFKDLPEKTVSARPIGGGWSAKEVLGHLTDSASNNHQRFVRLQITDNLAFPNYAQDNDAWVEIQKYQEMPWETLLTHWRYFNLHLTHLIRAVDKSCLDRRWIRENAPSISLGELMTDYLRHLNVHLQKIREQTAG